MVSNIQEYSKNENSYLTLSCYNLDNFCSYLKITMIKDDLESAKSIAKNIFDILSLDIYKNDFIIIQEHCLSHLSNISLILKDKDSINVPYVKSYNNSKFYSKKESFLLKLIDCLEYISKEHPYFNIEEQNEDEY